jgi:hypothetical protein
MGADPSFSTGRARTGPAPLIRGNALSGWREPTAACTESTSHGLVMACTGVIMQAPDSVAVSPLWNTPLQPWTR